jgi:hypothetical protein
MYVLVNQFDGLRAQRMPDQLAVAAGWLYLIINTGCVSHETHLGLLV